MTRTEGSTLTTIAAPTVLAIGCPPDLVARCMQALEGIGVSLVACELLNAVTVVAERRPLALLLLEDLYAFDPVEFDALARDVRASLVRVEEDIAAAKLELLLAAAIDRAAAERGESLPAPAEEAAPPTERDERGRIRRGSRTPPVLAYALDRPLPVRADLVAATWPSRVEAPPSSRSGT